ncbi:MAG: S24 family peptidase [Minwuiales bacterium]|nr:S24 family peptidase [Minwuiales bacterium]
MADVTAGKQRDATQIPAISRDLKTLVWSDNAGFRRGTLREFLASGANGLTSNRGPKQAGGTVDEPRMKPVIEPIYVRGAVQAGTWREALEWPRDDWYPIAVPPDDPYGGLARFGLSVRGPSMNAVYPDGATLICVRFADLGRGPETGDRVICQRHNPNGMIEATVKEFVIDDGIAWLWPRSYHPEHQTPIRLPDLPKRSDDLAYLLGDNPPVREAEAIELIALVVGSYIPE